MTVQLDERTTANPAPMAGTRLCASIAYSSSGSSTQTKAKPMGGGARTQSSEASY
jgi:hypothetical protein